MRTNERSRGWSGAFSAWGSALAALFLAVVSALPAWATDKVYLKDGRVIEGEIVRELEGAVWVKYKLGGIETQSFFGPSDIDKIERDASAPAPADPAVEPVRDASKARPRTPGVTRAVVLTCEETVGMQMSAKPLEEVIPMLEAEGVDVVVLKINSGGGFLLEIQKMHDVIVEQLKPKFRVVSWIESAISAAAMSSHVIEEIYFMPEGNYGACTGWSGALVAVKDRPLEEVLYMMERASAKGGYDIAIMRSMQIDVPLSCNIDADGNVKWYNTTEGQRLVNAPGRILTFDAAQAQQVKFSKGTASNLDELARAMGLNEVEWLGEEKPGEIFPIHAAELHQREWREKVTEAETRLNEYFAKYQISIQNAQSAQTAEQRGMFVGRAQRELNIIHKVCKDHPNFMLLLGLSEEWFTEQNELLRRLRRQP